MKKLQNLLLIAVSTVTLESYCLSTEKDLSQCETNPEEGVSLDVSHLSQQILPNDTLKRALETFENEGFKCQSFNPKIGLQCRGQLKRSGYREEVAFFIPAGYKPHTQTDLILHLHGHIGKNGNFDQVLEKFDFGELLAQTSRNSILIVPASKDRCETFNQSLSSNEPFDTFIQGAMALLKKSNLSLNTQPKTITLTGHSGAYLPIARLLKSKCSGDQKCAKSLIKEIYLFDALYGEFDTFAKFVLQNKNHKLVSVFPKSGTYKGNFTLWKSIHKNLSETLFQTQTLPPQLKALPHNCGGANFILSDKNHFETVNKYFPILLKTKSTEL